MDHLSVIAVALGGLAVTLGIEALLKPRPAWKRPLSSWWLHGGLWCLSLGAVYLLTGRPLFSGINALAAWLLVVLVSNAKYHSLREPFVCADFEYFSDAVRFPRLYLPFFGVGKAIALAVFFLAYVAGGLYLEPRAEGAPSVALGLLMIAVAMLWLGHRQWREPTFDAGRDLREWGLPACLWRYFMAARRPVDVSALQSPFAEPAKASTLTMPALPDMISIQSESFFDVRALFPGVRRGVLRHFDQLRRESLAQGPLQVAAWGANTVRTEFAYLTGLAGDRLGVHRFNPYRLLARKGLPSIAAHFKRQGYRTVCIHPYAGSFYGRDRVLPALGFDAFIDVSGFDDSQKAGPFIGDCAVAENVIALLQAVDRRPLFIHVVTMENHGPLQLEHVPTQDLPTWFDQPLPPALRDLGPYVRHIANADRMLGLLHAHLAHSPRPAGLCFYGDHVPILPQVYNALGAPAGNTEYFIWSNRARARRACLAEPLPVQRLGEAFLREVQYSYERYAAADVASA